MAATYNVHQFVGRDRVQSVERIASVIQRLDADIIGLQEVDSQPGSDSRIQYLSRQTGFEAVFGPAVRRLDSDFGNVLLTRFPIVCRRRINLSYKTREPRGAIDVDLRVGEREVRVLVTHLGLNAQERFWQVNKLMRLISVGTQELQILMGDLNEWWPFSRNLRRLDGFFGASTPVRSYPSGFPLLALDRIWVQPCTLLREVRVVDCAEIRTASDHLPVRACLELSQPVRR